MPHSMQIAYYLYDFKRLLYKTSGLLQTPQWIYIYIIMRFIEQIPKNGGQRFY